MQAQFVTQLVYVRKIANVRYENRQFFSTNSRVSDESVSIIVLASEFCSTAASIDRNQQKCHEKIVTLICCCVARGTKNDDSKSVPKVLLIELSDFSIAVGMAITKLLRSQIRVLMNLLDDETVASCVFFCFFLLFHLFIYIFFVYVDSFTMLQPKCCYKCNEDAFVFEIAHQSRECHARIFFSYVLCVSFSRIVARLSCVEDVSIAHWCGFHRANGAKVQIL